MSIQQEERIANLGQVSIFLHFLACQKCMAIGLTQLVCLKCQENVCFKCVQAIPYKDESPRLQLPAITHPIADSQRYVADQNYRAICPMCENPTIMSSMLPLIFHKLYTTIKYHCTNKINGCLEEYSIIDLRHHESKCRYQRSDHGMDQFQINGQGLNSQILSPHRGNRNDHQDHHFQVDLIEQINALKVQCLSLQAQVNMQHQEIQKLKGSEEYNLNLSPDKQSSISFYQQSQQTPQKQNQLNQKTNYLDSPFSLQSLISKSAKLIEDNTH